MKDRFLNSVFLLIILSVLFTAASISFVLAANAEDILGKVLPVTLTILVILTGIHLGLFRYFRNVSEKMLDHTVGMDSPEQSGAGKADSHDSVMAERERRLRDMYSDVSHEMKTPLTTIRGYAEMMENRMIPEEDIPVVAAKMNEESCHLLSMIERVMESMRHPEDFPCLKREDIDMLNTVDAVVERLRPRAEKKKIRIFIEGDPISLFCDRDLYEQICYNIIDNAIKYTKEGGAVRIFVNETAIGKRLIVSDNGIGISVEDQKRIFDRFFRADRSHSRSEEGTGLGLPIVKHHTDMLGAELILNSDLGKGTEITILFH